MFLYSCRHSLTGRPQKHASCFAEKERCAQRGRPEIKMEKPVPGRVLNSRPDNLSLALPRALFLLIFGKKTLKMSSPCGRCDYLSTFYFFCMGKCTPTPTHPCFPFFVHSNKRFAIVFLCFFQVQGSSAG